ncbi:MAG TPA: hypothetical protein VMG12_07265 [Polyangiaceae bacterium]|nr:hypothetical protein [Polyangiaceae bacterium]
MDAPFVYDVPSECGEHSEWLRSVRARLPPLLQTHPLLATLSVRIQKIASDGADQYSGELVASPSGELSSSRRVRGATCDEVLDALAFIGALGLERAAASQRAVGSGDVDAGAGERGREPEALSLAASAQPPIGADGSRAQRVPPGGHPVQLGAMGFGLVQSGLVPGQSLALGAAVRAAWSGAGWQPLLSLGAYSNLPEERRLEGGGRVRYEHWSLYAVACPRRFPAAGFWGVRPCAELDVGRSSGEAVGVDAAERHAAPWLSAGAQLRTELVLWGRVELALSLAGVAPLFRSHFFVNPGVERFDTPAWGLRAGSFATLLF